MKKAFLSPFFMPIAVAALWGTVLFFMLRIVPESVKDGEPIERMTRAFYMVMLGVMLCLIPFFKKERKLKELSVFFLLGLAGLLREMGAQHWLTRHDSTAFKIRFFTNPNNPLSEKIGAGLVALVIVAALLYLAVKYARRLIVSFFKLDTVAWSVATLCGIGIFGKLVDRFPSNYRKWTGIPLDEKVGSVFLAVEETSEMFLPVIAALALIQFYLIRQAKTHADHPV